MIATIICPPYLTTAYVWFIAAKKRIGISALIAQGHESGNRSKVAFFDLVIKGGNVDL
jgi:hypothetical protein